MNKLPELSVKYKISNLLIAVVSVLLCIAGWKLFWFLTDDAFIAFRYIANSQEGFGYVWNRPPFLPVEGYTSFLWIFLLDTIWSLTGFTPPESANTVSLLFSTGTILLMLKLIRDYAVKNGKSHRVLIYQVTGALILLSNRAFLTWTSSGLETAMFNFFMFLWFYSGFRINYSKLSSLLLFSSSAALIALTRPDGLLFVCATGVILLDQLLSKSNRSVTQRLLAFIPLIAVPIHLMWRFMTYGEWLPNTYYAKSGGMWPEAGLRYLLCFIMEHFLIIWIAILIFILIKNIKQLSPFKPKEVLKNRKELIMPVISAAFIFHILYYVFFIGGDHFEYRILSHTIPLISFSFIYFFIHSSLKQKYKIVILLLFLVLSVQIPFTHWNLTHSRNTRAETGTMFVPVAEDLPLLLRSYGRLFDNMQQWLINHFICTRHQEHKVFYQFMDRLTRKADLDKYIKEHNNPVFAVVCVGVIGWKHTDAHIIDLLGLNDYVAARTKSRNSYRLMAHERGAPLSYVNELKPLVAVQGDGRILLFKRKGELTDEAIKEVEQKYRNKLNKKNT